MKFRILKVEKRWWNPFSFYRTRATVKLEDDTVFKINSWPVHDNYFLNHIMAELRRRLRAKQEKSEGKQSSRKRSQILSHTFDTDQSYKETRFEIENLEEAS
jgi:hypothetical protein